MPAARLGTEKVSWFSLFWMRRQFRALWKIGEWSMLESLVAAFVVDGKSASNTYEACGASPADGFPATPSSRPWGKCVLRLFNVLGQWSFVGYENCDDELPVVVIGIGIWKFRFALGPRTTNVFVLFLGTFMQKGWDSCSLYLTCPYLYLYVSSIISFIGNTGTFDSRKKNVQPLMSSPM